MTFVKLKKPTKNITKAKAMGLKMENEKQYTVQGLNDHEGLFQGVDSTIQTPLTTLGPQATLKQNQGRMSP